MGYTLCLLTSLQTLSFVLEIKPNSPNPGTVKALLLAPKQSLMHQAAGQRTEARNFRMGTLFFWGNPLVTDNWSETDNEKV